MDADSRKSTHLKIARLLQERGYSNQDLLFTIAFNYNLASDLVAAMPPDAIDRVKLVCRRGGREGRGGEGRRRRNVRLQSSNLWC